MKFRLTQNAGEKMNNQNLLSVVLICYFLCSSQPMIAEKVETFVILNKAEE